MKDILIDTHTFIGNPGELEIPPAPVTYFEDPKFEKTKFLVIPLTPEQTPETLALVRRHERFAGMYLFANPNKENRLWTPANRVEEQRQYASEEGVVGIKSHPALFDIAMDDKRYDPIYEMAIEHELPVLLHASSSGQDYNSPDKTRTVMQRFPDLKLIFAHFGGARPEYMRDAIALVEEYPNLYLNTTCLHHIGASVQMDNRTYRRNVDLTPSPERIALRDKAGEIFRDASVKISEKIIFGSDLGWYPPSDYSHWPITEVGQDKAKIIFSSNPKTLFGDKLLRV